MDGVTILTRVVIKKASMIKTTRLKHSLVLCTTNKSLPRDRYFVCDTTDTRYQSLKISKQLDNHYSVVFNSKMWFVFSEKRIPQSGMKLKDSNKIFPKLKPIISKKDKAWSSTIAI